MQDVIRKSPAVIVKSFVVLQAVAVISYIVAGPFAHYAELYRAMSWPGNVSFQIAQLVFLFSIETVLVFYIFFRWHKEYLKVERNRIIERWGIIWRKERMILLKDIRSIDYRQGLLGRLVKYGTIKLKLKIKDKDIVLKYIPDPEKVRKTILDYKEIINGEDIASKEYESLDKILNKEEHGQLEFKSSFRWDLNGNRVNKDLEKAAMKTIAGFLNSQGGQLVLGVGDDRSVIGLKNDYSTLRKRNADGFENHFSHIFNTMIGAEFRRLVNVGWHTSNGQECCVVKVGAGYKPVYLRADGNEEFYIRTGNGTTSLKLSEAASYIDFRFEKV
jgi:membrane protein YdbS with pleckstrin-like domain